MALHPLLERLTSTVGAHVLQPDDIATWEAESGDAVLLFGGDPVRFPEALDVAVVLPELRAAFGAGWRVGLVPGEAEDRLARRYAVQRWPSLVFLRAGGWLGTVSGMKDWDDYRHEVAAVLAATPRPRPAPTIAIQVANGTC